MAGDPPDILIQPVARKYLRLISIARTLPLRLGSWQWKRKWMNFCRWYAPTFDQNFYLHLS
ncbi:Uncharacterised protein [Escherichia coli]|uniref:Uncharacterized protein n=1 Tax=Escherichia coli TaxID=562 RepID=A0A376MVZ8_ECOLX|nr:Uncharacterised protein [Escherichia coli]